MHAYLCAYIRCGVDVGAPVDQEADDVDVVHLRGNVDRRGSSLPMEKTVETMQSAGGTHGAIYGDSASPKPQGPFVAQFPHRPSPPRTTIAGCGPFRVVASGPRGLQRMPAAAQAGKLGCSAVTAQQPLGSPSAQTLSSRPLPWPIRASPAASASGYY